MKDSEKISHRGSVVSVSESAVEVNIVSESACATCHAKGMCGMADAKDKKITVADAGNNFQEGEQVTVTLHSSLGLKAVCWAYLFPLLLLLLILVTLLNIHASEGLSALLALAAVALYYTLLWRYRGKFTKKFIFEIEKQNQ